MLWTAFGEQWSLNHKVTFDGVNRLIIIGPNTFNIDVKVDLYSSWKEWVLLYDNSKFLPAFRVIGGDPIEENEFTGDVYFLINNWKILIDHSCIFNGVIYSDDFSSPFVTIDGTHIVTNKVSAIVNKVNISGNSGISPADIWNYPLRTLTSYPPYNGPTVQQIRQELDINSIKLAQIKAILDSMNIPSVVDIRTEIDNNSTKLQQIIEKQSEALTKADYLALS